VYLICIEQLANDPLEGLCYAVDKCVTNNHIYVSFIVVIIPSNSTPTHMKDNTKAQQLMVVSLIVTRRDDV
jgi:hypothetical protein